jgi:hypothetical protein
MVTTCDFLFFFVHLTQVVVTSKILHVDRIQHQLSTHFY